MSSATTEQVETQLVATPLDAQSFNLDTAMLGILHDNYQHVLETMKSADVSEDFKLEIFKTFHDTCVKLAKGARTGSKKSLNGATATNGEKKPRKPRAPRADKKEKPAKQQKQHKKEKKRALEKQQHDELSTSCSDHSEEEEEVKANNHDDSVASVVASSSDDEDRAPLAPPKNVTKKRKEVVATSSKDEVSEEFAPLPAPVGKKVKIQAAANAVVAASEKKKY